MANNIKVIDPIIMRVLESGAEMTRNEIIPEVGYPRPSVCKALLRLVRCGKVVELPTNIIKGRPKALAKYRLSSAKEEFEFKNSPAMREFDLENSTVRKIGAKEWGKGSIERDPLVAALFGPSKSNNSMAAS